MSMLFKRIKDWATSITAFRTGDVIPVDGPSGTAKMAVDKLLEITAKNSEPVVEKLVYGREKLAYTKRWNAKYVSDSAVVGGNISDYLIGSSYRSVFEIAVTESFDGVFISDVRTQSSGAPEIIYTDSNGLILAMIPGQASSHDVTIPYVEGTSYIYFVGGTNSSFDVYKLYNTEFSLLKEESESQFNSIEGITKDVIGVAPYVWNLYRNSSYIDPSVDVGDNISNKLLYTNFRKVGYVEIPEQGVGVILDNVRAQYSDNPIAVAVDSNGSVMYVVNGGSTLQSVSVPYVDGMVAVYFVYGTSADNVSASLLYNSNSPFFVMQKKTAPLSSYSEVNFLADGDSITAGGQWDNIVNSAYSFKSHTNIGVGSSSWADRWYELNGVTYTPQTDVGSPDFAGFSSSTSHSADTIQAEVNNCARIHLLKLIYDVSNGSKPEPNLLVWSFGTNDISTAYHTTLGDADSVLATGRDYPAGDSLYTLAGGLKYTLQKATEVFSNCRFVILLPIQSGSAERNALNEMKISVIKKIANAFSVPVIDMYNECGISWFTESKNSEGRYLRDGLHPNTLGQEMMGNFVTKQLLSILTM